MSRTEQLRGSMSAALQRQPRTDSTAEPAPRPRPVRTALVRMTVDLEPALHRSIKRWALEHDTTQAEVTRVLLQLLADDETLAGRVADRLNSVSQ